MTACAILYNAVPMDMRNYYAGSRAIATCSTHGMSDFIVMDGMCPVGRIEKAADDAVMRIEVLESRLTDLLNDLKPTDLK